ncbi:MAG: MBL fold metallo-hydrolase [Bulleidia sp.]
MTDVSAMKINDGLIRLNERSESGLNVDAWLILGSEKALLVDALEETEMLYELVTSLSSLPLQVVITHGHIDHAGKSVRKFLEHDVPVYMNEKDRGILVNRNLYTTQETEQLKPVCEGDVFDLGNRKIEVVECAGHTEGSICLFDWDSCEVFTGDAVGSGDFWMQLPESLPMHDFVENLLHFRQTLVGMHDFVIYPGHISQQMCTMGMQYLDDVLSICTSLCENGPQGETGEMNLGGTYLKYRSIGNGQLHQMLYNPDRI